MSPSPEIPSWLEEESEEPAEENLRVPIQPHVRPIKKRSNSALTFKKIWEDRRQLTGKWTPPVSLKVSLKNLSIFSKQLGLMMGSGVTLVKAFDILGTQGEDKKLREAALKVKEGVLSGYAISSALEKKPDIFPPFFRFAVRSAETSGTLPKTLLKLSDYYEKINLQNQKVKGSLIYPVFVFVTTLALFMFLISYIFPMFSSFFKGLHYHLPLITRILFFVFRLLTSVWFWGIILVLGVGLYAAWKTSIKRSDFALWLNIQQLQIPLAGPCLQKIQSSYFCRTLATMLNAGVNLLTALEVFQKGIGMPVFKIFYNNIQEELRAGSSLSQTIKDISFFPRAAQDLILVGEESGNLSAMLEKAADFLDIEIDTLIQNLMTLIEPLLILFLGVMVAMVLIGIFLPLYSAISQIH